MRQVLRNFGVISIATALLLSGCASFGDNKDDVKVDNVSTPTPQTLYRLPAEIKQGYWAMTRSVGLGAMVVDFRGNMTTRYTFKCNDDGSFTQLDVETHQLVPSATGVKLTYDDDAVLSELRVKRVVPKRLLEIKQVFLNDQLKQAIPKGREFDFIYTPTLKPFCKTILDKDK